jgi:hypothetical protein
MLTFIEFAGPKHTFQPEHRFVAPGNQVGRYPISNMDLFYTLKPDLPGGPNRDVCRK